MSRLLLLEDDPILSREVSTFLTSKGFECDCVFDGDLFFRQLGLATYEAYLLDINVPKLNGLDVCKRIRSADSTTPIVMLTAYGEIQDKFDAFQHGADDYLVKPFHLDELYIRIMALLRRSSQPQEKTDLLKVADLELDLTEMKVKRAGRSIELTPKEYQLLLFLVKAKGRTVSKQTIAEAVWDIHFETSLNTIEVYINFLRKKIDKDHDKKLIHTRPGFGYFISGE
ncbi:response regulator transcription factor [Persicitalea jodogahamensis]|uniref:DNA-binding response regulator n=1 Tax=Persicitalea jodogahamensis TaxID=402147 RepID=A0A8J3G9R3_9BACT|nr:response regulator transcription factor [Persicitalea jodogahamensis]GHB65279.1 DNA-binding response regulator [Persicitalea jodogahamensis]